MMNIDNAQQAVDQWIKNHGVRYFDELTNMAQLQRRLAKLRVSLLADMVNNRKKKATKRKTWVKNSLMCFLSYSVWQIRLGWI